MNAFLITAAFLLNQPWAPGPAESQWDLTIPPVVSEPLTARLTVLCHTDAVITIDGTATTSTGPDRVFQSQSLEPGKEYQHQFRVTAGGATWTKTVTFRAGDSITIDLRGKAVQPLAAVPFAPPIVRRDGPGAKAAGPQYHQGHTCPNCGTTQTAISGAGPVRGTHTHTCPRCLTTWFH